MTASQWLGLAIQVSIMLTVVGLGLTATFQDATFLFRRPRLLLRTVVSMNIIMPVVVWLIATTFALPAQLQVALVSLAVSPVPPIIQKKQITAGGREEYVVGLMVAMSLLAIILVPLTVELCDRLFHLAATVSPLTIAEIMLKTVLGPLSVALLIKYWFPKAQKASGAIISVAGILLIIGVIPLAIGLWPNIKVFIGNGVVVMLVVIAAIGLLVGHLLGGPRPGDRTTLAMATSARHPAVALAIATSGVVSEPKPALAAILLYLIVATVVAVPYQIWRTRSDHPKT